MKKLKKFLIPLLLAVCSVSCLFVACGEEETPPPPESKIVSIIFKQTGQDDVIKYLDISKNTTLSSIPTPVAKTGYTVVWDRTDFSNITADLVVNAVITPNTYVITYDLGEMASDSSVSITALTQDVVFDSNVVTYKPTCNGFEFVGWTIKDSNPEIVFSDGLYQIANNVTLIANWVELDSNKCKITFKQEGLLDVIKQVSKGQTLTDVPAPAEVAGYTVTWDRTDFTNVTTDIIVNAIITPNTYVITYDLGERASDPSVFITAYTQDVVFDSNVVTYKPTCQNYDFVGWIIKDSDPEETFNDGAYTIPDNVTLVAKWEIKKVTVTFKQEGVADVLKKVGIGQTLTDVPTPADVAGYTVSWNRTDFANITTDITVNAILTPRNYTITYNLGSREADNYASIAQRTQQVVFGSEVTTITPSCKGYIFKGWLVKNKTDNGQPVYFNGGKYVYAEDVVLIAQWELDPNSEDRYSPFVPSN